MSPYRLALFDIDGTLVDVKGAGSRAIGRALRFITGRDDLFIRIDVEGKTVLEVIQSQLEASGYPWHSYNLDQIRRVYLSSLSEEMAVRPGRILPGVSRLLAELEEDDTVLSTLLTGNYQAGAIIKLKAFNIDHYFATGAFGDDERDRNRLLPIAVKRVEELTGVAVSFNHCVVVGDTPRDVACGAVHGARTLAVATGDFSRRELEEAGADLVVADLSDTKLVVDFIHNGAA